MKATTLRLAPHTTVPGETVAEIWHNGVLVGTVFGDDGCGGCGIRVLTKYALSAIGGIVHEPPVPGQHRLAEVNVMINPHLRA